MRGRIVLPALVVASLGVMGSAADAPRAPQFVNIVAACNPSGNQRVEPSQVRIKFADNVVWRVVGNRAASFTITPKDVERWPFRRDIGGNQTTSANSGSPAAGTAAGTYGYNVNITCADGSTQLIDPDIIIGEDD
ncbi:MAG TPA: hypothetical protein VJ997_03070 [Longimicrobiales bacterium]|nr:hypothetical protein [Longimicrobiales bacterium]